jgi:hypothetical protein
LGAETVILLAVAVPGHDGFPKTYRRVTISISADPVR